MQFSGGKILRLLKHSNCLSFICTTHNMVAPQLTETIFAGISIFQPCHQSSLLSLGSMLGGKKWVAIGLHSLLHVYATCIGTGC